MDTFKAGVQYGDWEGTAAADGFDPLSVEKYLTEKGLIESNETVIAVSFWSGEGHVSNAVYLFARKEYDSSKEALEKVSGEIPVRKVRLELSTEEFLAIFKRFNVILTARRLELTDRGFNVENE